MLLPFIITGLTTGSVYGLAGVGLVLTYKTSGVFNFAHGALATISAYLFYSMYVQHDVAWPLAAVVCLFVLSPLLGIGLEWIARLLASSSLTTRVVSTIGIFLIVQALAVIIYGTTLTRSVPVYLGRGRHHIGDTVVTTNQILVFVIGAVATAVLFVFFRRTRTGVAMRAVVDAPDLLDLTGTSPVRVRRWAWIIGVIFSSASGLLLVPFITLDATTLTFLVIAAFGAAALGGFSNLPGTYIGGLVIGVLAALATKYFTSGLLSALPTSLPFLVLFAVLLVAPRRRLAERAPVTSRSHANWNAPWRFQFAFIIPLMVVLCLVPNFAGYHLADYTQFLAISIMFLSLGLLVRTSGQVSLCHISFMAIGACAFSHLTVDHGWPWGLAVVCASLIAVPIGALLAIPAIRLSGLYLALATFGFGLLLEFMFYSQSYMFGQGGIGVFVPQPRLSAVGLRASDKPYYYFVLAMVVVTTGVVVGITRSRLGRLLRALSDSPTGLTTSGTSVNITRVLVFCISAFLAAFAGVLQAGAIGQVSDISYQPITSLVYFALVIINVGGAPWYAITAAAGLVLVPSYLTNSNTSNWLQVLFGVFALLYAVTPDSRRGAPLAVRTAIDKVARGGRRLRARAPVDGPALVPASAPHVTPGSLRVSELRVAFGGLVAVDGVGLEAPTGRITGLIGPNGAGKTTTFNACSGLVRPDYGKIFLDGADVTRRGPASRARQGLGRTYQRTELFDSLTVRENVSLGLEGGYAGTNPLRHIVSSPGSGHLFAEATERALRQCDLLPLAETTVGSLSTGQRRLVELARCLAGPFRILLLDEPSSGLDRVETARFGEILCEVVTDRGIGILLVEHDMTLVTSVCDYIYVLDFGKPIFEGTPEEVVTSPTVQAAYLGSSTSVGAAPAPTRPRREPAS